MKVRRPIKYLLIVAGLAAGWAAGGLLDRGGEPAKVVPGHREPRSRPATRPATQHVGSAVRTDYLAVEQTRSARRTLPESNVAGTITARR
jgi:hypothetical protein